MNGKQITPNMAVAAIGVIIALILAFGPLTSSESQIDKQERVQLVKVQGRELQVFNSDFVIGPLKPELSEQPEIDPFTSERLPVADVEGGSVDVLPPPMSNTAPPRLPIPGVPVQ